MNNLYNVWNKWDKLKTVVLGNCYYPEFFRDVKNSKIRSALQQISEETHEDLENFQAVLKSFGCEVLRPKLDKNESIVEHLRDEKLRGVPRPPLQPRDYFAVIGKNMYYGGSDHKAIVDCVFDYNTKDVVEWKDKKFIGPTYTLVGKDLYVDVETLSEFTPFYSGHHLKMQELNPDLRVNLLRIGGHNDGCFHVLKPGALLSLNNIQRYKDTFPGWDVCYLPFQSWDKVEGFMKMKSVVNGRWWVPGQEDNKEFIYFVECWLEDWVGYCEESVFDVNVLMLDEHNICVNNYDKDVFDFLKKHKIEPTIIPWRHRYFWDGGLHCITLDLYREGEMKNYFPDRIEPVIDEGFD